MRIEFSFDDGHRFDIHTARLLKENGFRGMFYIQGSRNGENFLSDEDILALSKDHDIGFHSWSHPQDMKRVQDIDMEVTRGRDELEELIGRPITSFCYPKGKFDERTIEALKRNGYTEGRSVNVLHYTQSFDPFRKPTTSHFHPYKKEYEGYDWLLMIRSAFLRSKEEGENGYFHLWGHSEEINRFSAWKKFDDMLKFIKEQL